ncbi:MAG: hypothetical protein WKG01_31030 [Kofleriaceae bacterium]
MSLCTVLALVSTTGCKKKPKDQPAPVVVVDAASGSDMGSDLGSGMGAGSDMAGSGSDMAGSGSAGDMTMTKQGGNCPSMVSGSTTKAEVKGKDVVLTITATDKDAIAAIQTRTTALLKEKGDGAATGSAHDQKGTVGGGKGMCPVHFGDGGKGTAKKDPKGMVITITTSDAAALKTTIDDRITKAADWVKTNVKEGDKGTSGGVGGGKGGHGQNHSGSGDSKGKERGSGDGKGGGAGTGGGAGKGTGRGSAGNKDGSGA